MVINSVKCIWFPPWQIADIIQNIKTSLRSFASWTIRHVLREAHKAANWIANVDHLVDSQFNVENCIRSALHSILVNERLELPSCDESSNLFSLSLEKKNTLQKSRRPYF